MFGQKLVPGGMCQLVESTDVGARLYCGTWFDGFEVGQALKELTIGRVLQTLDQVLLCTACNHLPTASCTGGLSRLGPDAHGADLTQIAIAIYVLEA